MTLANPSSETIVVTVMAALTVAMILGPMLARLWRRHLRGKL
jgi:hypothetical protein